MILILSILALFITFLIFNHSKSILKLPLLNATDSRKNLCETFNPNKFINQSRHSIIVKDIWFSNDQSPSDNTQGSFFMHSVYHISGKSLG